MKNIMVITCLILMTFSCNKKEEKKVVGKRLTLNEQYCEIGRKKAISDIKKNKIVYHNYKGFAGEEEFVEMLSKFGIEVKDGYVGCLTWIDKNGQSCYAEIMKKEIERKYGVHFLDSIQKLAEKEYVLKNQNLIYDYNYGCDTISIYPHSRSFYYHSVDLERDFDSFVKYPKGYDHRKEKLFSTTEINFILTKSGIAKDITAETDFVNPRNKKFIPYFEKKAIEFVKNTKWIPAKKCGIDVNSKVKLILEHT